MLYITRSSGVELALVETDFVRFIKVVIVDDFFYFYRICEFVLRLLDQQMYLSTVLFILPWFSQCLCLQCSFGMMLLVTRFYGFLDLIILFY